MKFAGFFYLLTMSYNNKKPRLKRNIPCRIGDKAVEVKPLFQLKTFLFGITRHFYYSDYNVKNASSITA